MAEDYVARIREIQPHGPYHLLGWSFGGAVAHEMAVLLRAAGERVALLALLDSGVGGGTGATAPSGPETLTQLLESLGHRVPDDPADLTPAGVLRLLRAEFSPLAALGEDRLAAVVTTFTDNARLADGFTPGIHDGDLLCFTAADSAPAHGEERHTAWTPHATGRVRHHPVPCAHGAMVQPAALAVIGPVLARALADT
ncbi:hypothetical protein JK363_21895 [Streptomyces sp. 205]|uniref:Thioesterase domain-containing protein n=1 Tax=Streptomyces coffeae TaxID=621382 RepID=A0ABS1NGN3_9ACTN|nr:hypothetical protein [Streptomyces coffeae]